MSQRYVRPRALQSVTVFSFWFVMRRVADVVSVDLMRSEMRKNAVWSPGVLNHKLSVTPALPESIWCGALFSHLCISSGEK